MGRLLDVRDFATGFGGEAPSRPYQGNPQFREAVSRMYAPERMRGAQQVSSDYNFGMPSEEDYVRDIAGEDTPYAKVPELDERAVGFWEKAADLMGKDGVKMQGKGNTASAVGLLLALGGMFADRAGRQKQARIDKQKAQIKAVEDENEQARIDNRGRETSRRAARAAYHRERAALAKDARKEIREGNRREEETVVDPKTGKRYRADSEAGLRISNPSLANEVYGKPGDKPGGGSEWDLSSVGSHRVDEAEARFKEARGAIVRGRAGQNKKDWGIYSSNPETFAAMTPGAEDSIRAGLAPAGADSTTAGLYKRAGAANKSLVARRYAEDFRKVRSPESLKALVYRANQEGVDVNDPDFLDAYAYAKDRLGAAPR